MLDPRKRWGLVAVLVLASACGRVGAREVAPTDTSVGKSGREAGVRWQGGWIRPDQGEAGMSLAHAAWVWFPEGDAASSAPVGTRYFRRRIDLPQDRKITSARIAMTADNAFELFLNGRRAGRGDNFHTVYTFRLGSKLQPGANTLAVAVTNRGEAPNPAGLIGSLKIEFNEGAPATIPTDTNWRTSDKLSPGWEQPGFDDSSWPAVQALGANGIAPWGKKQVEPASDVYVGFRGAFELPHDAEVTLKIIGAHWFQAGLDGMFLTEGPARFPPSHPEYEVLNRNLKAGRHLVTALVHDEGVSTRMLQADVIPPFFLCEVTVEGRPIDVRWKCARMPGYIASGVRMSPQFAWIEWVDTRANPAGWRAADFDDSTWQPPAPTVAARWAMRPLGIGHVKEFVHRPKRIAEGRLTGPFESAEIPDWPEEDSVSWYRRNLDPNVGHVSNVPTTQRHVGNVPHNMRARRAEATGQDSNWTAPLCGWFWS